MKIRDAFAHLLSGLAALASLLVCALILGVTADVVVRNLFGRTIRGIDELSEYMLYLVCLLPAPWLVWQRQQIRIDLVLNCLSPRAAARAENAIDVISVLVCGLFAMLGLLLAIGSAQAGTMIYKSFTFPEWWLYAPLPVIMGLMAIAFAMRAVDRLATQQSAAGGAPGEK
jgi:TRAP-type C4-dicarboxylate transport system permease small subunit